jgi:hypothetical protein
MYPDLRPNDQNAKRARLFIRINTFFALANLFLHLYLAIYVRDHNTTYGNVIRDFADWRLILLLIHLPVLVIYLIFFLSWFSRAYVNLHEARSPWLTFGKGWAVWGWFVPIVNLGRPHAIMSEIWLRKQFKERQPPYGGIKAVDRWWFHTLLSFFLFVLAGFLIPAPYNGYYIRTGAWIGVAASLFEVSALWWLYKVVVRISGFEEKWLEVVEKKSRKTMLPDDLRDP